MTMNLVFDRLDEMKKKASSQKVKKFGTNKYIGQLKNGQPHGKGKFIGGNGTYVGQFKDGKYHGKGKWISWTGEESIVTSNNGKMTTEKIIKPGKNKHKLGLGTVTLWVILLGLAYIFYLIAINILT